jgi:hypothetical protein
MVRLTGINLICIKSLALYLQFAGSTSQKISIIVSIQQCGTVAKVLDCYDANGTVGCNCINDETMPLSFLKISN